MQKFITVSLREASNRQILLSILKATARLATLPSTVTHLESTVTELSSAVAELRSAVSSLAERVQTQMGPLQDALVRAQQTLDEFTLADEIEDADFARQIEELKSQVQARVNEAQDAAAQIDSSVAEINQIGQQPAEEPVQEPVQEPVEGSVEEPAGEEQTA
jgi:uncharacterized coiled-coil protein SlyX